MAIYTAATASKYISPYFYCHCPEGTNHMGVDLRTIGKAARDDLNTFWHVITGNNNNFGIASVREIREFATSIFNRGQPVTTGYEIEIANSFRYTKQQMELFFYRSITRDGQYPFYQKSVVYLNERIFSGENHTVQLKFINDFCKLGFSRLVLKADNFFKEGKWQEAHSLLSTYFQQNQQAPLRLPFLP